MEKRIISEINRINTLIESNLLNEQLAPIVNFLRRLIRTYGDDVIKNMIKQGDDAAESSLNAIKRGDQITDDAADYLVRNLDFGRIAINLFDNAGFGRAYREKMREAAQSIKSGSKTRQEILRQFENAIDQSDALADAPDELLVALKQQLPDILDDVIRKYNSEIFRKIGQVSRKVFNKLPLVSRNLKNIVKILAEQAKRIENLKSQIENIINF